MAEIPDPGNRLRKMGNQHYDMVHNLIVNLTRQLVASDKERYSRLNVTDIANDYMLILVGAIAMTEVYNSTWPAQHAVETVKRLIE